jgi:hypothetical protein
MRGAYLALGQDVWWEPRLGADSIIAKVLWCKPEGVRISWRKYTGSGENHYQVKRALVPHEQIIRVADPHEISEFYDQLRGYFRARYHQDVFT